MDQHIKDLENPQVAEVVMYLDEEPAYGRYIKEDQFQLPANGVLRANLVDLMINWYGFGQNLKHYSQ